MPKFICKLFPGYGEPEWDEDGRLILTLHTYDTETVIEAAMLFYHEEGDFPDLVGTEEVVREEQTRRPLPKSEAGKNLEANRKELQRHIVCRQRTVKAIHELFHAAKVAKLAVNTSEGIIRR